VVFDYYRLHVGSERAEAPRLLISKSGGSNCEPRCFQAWLLAKGLLSAQGLWSTPLVSQFGTFFITSAPLSLVTRRVSTSEWRLISAEPGPLNSRDATPIRPATNQVLFLRNTMRTRYCPVISSCSVYLVSVRPGDGLLISSNPFILFW